MKYALYEKRMCTFNRITYTTPISGDCKLEKLSFPMLFSNIEKNVSSK